MQIRLEQSDDVESIWQINTSAFATNAEARLVNLIRDSDCECISLVAEIDSDKGSIIVGHILFSPVELSHNRTNIKLMGLAPMAVTPEYQKQHIGSMLVKAGLEQCKMRGYDAVVVLGHPSYYPRFGFVPASRFNLQSEYDVPDEVFMAIELNSGALENNDGVIRYHPAFNQV